MHGFLALVVTVNNEIEHVAVSRFHSDKLLAAPGAAADIVDQRKVPVRRQGGIAAAAHKLLKQLAQFIRINGQR